MSNSRKTGLLSDGIVDSAMVETVFKTIKNELAWKAGRRISPWPTSTASTIHVGDIPLWYTNRRYHSRPKWPSQSESLSTKSGQVQLWFRRKSVVARLC